MLCLVTDRKRLLAALGRGAAEVWAVLLAQIRGAARGGVDVVQIREPDLEAAALADLARQALDAIRHTPTRVVINDRLDVALAAQAHGVHLREDSLPVAAARRLTGSAFLVGRSVHRVPATPVNGVDYLIAGHVFDTASKPGAATPLGLRGLADIVRAAGDTPVWAIGGVTKARIGPVLAQGARGAAAIGAFMPSGPIADVEAAVQELSKTLRFEFDSAQRLP